MNTQRCRSTTYGKYCSSIMYSTTRPVHARHDRHDSSAFSYLFQSHRARGLHNAVLSHAMPDHPPFASAECFSTRESYFTTPCLARCDSPPWETEIRRVGDTVFLLVENDQNNALRFSHVFAVDFETLK